MDRLDIEEFALENKLDVREVNPYHYRLLDEYGKYVFDIFFKFKGGRVIRNATHVWKTNKWFYPNTIKNLKQKLKEIYGQ